MLNKEEVEEARKNLKQQVKDVSLIEDLSKFSNAVNEIMIRDKSIQTLLKYVDKLEIQTSRNKALIEDQEKKINYLEKENDRLHEVIWEVIDEYQFKDGHNVKQHCDKNIIDCDEYWSGDCHYCIKNYFRTKVEHEHYLKELRESEKK